MSQCSHCESERLEWVAPWRGDLYEPAGGGYWECLDCGWTMDDPDYEWERRVCKAEAEWDDMRGH
jgi:hypothetical protein